MSIYSVKVCPENCLGCTFSKPSEIAKVRCGHPNPVRKTRNGIDYCYSFEFGDINDIKRPTK